MNKKFTPKALFQRVQKKIKDRPKPLPLDWYYILWENNPVLMNVRPLWGYRPAHLVEEEMHSYMEHHIVKHRRLPTVEEINSHLRNDKSLRESIADLFQRKCSVEMTEVDYEIGLRYATGKLSSPKTLEAPQMAEMVERGTATAGQLIYAFYSHEEGSEQGY